MATFTAGWTSATCNRRSQVFFKSRCPKLGVEMGSWNQNVWNYIRLCCTLSQFLLSKSYELQCTLWHMAKGHFWVLANSHWHVKIKLRESLKWIKYILHTGFISGGNNWFISKQSLVLFIVQSCKKNGLHFQIKCPSTKV